MPMLDMIKDQRYKIVGDLSMGLFIQFVEPMKESEQFCTMDIRDDMLSNFNLL